MGLADAVLSAFFQVVFQYLASPILEEIGLQWGVTKEMKKLSRKLLRIREVLNDAEQRQISEESVRIWMRDLRDVVYDTEDILDQFTTGILQVKFEKGNQTNQVCNFSTSYSSNPAFFRSDMAHKINEIMIRLDELVKETVDLRLREVVGGTYFHVRERPQTSSLMDDSDIFGRETDKNQVIDLLLSDQQNKKHIPVISIVGMGGLGKTTLVKLVYNEKRVKKHFDLRMWVCVSEDFDVKKLTKAIISSVTGKTSDLIDLDPLQVELQKLLKGKRFLLVLDDVWNENRNHWSDLKTPFRVGRQGSRIIVTTRSEIVSESMGSTVYPLGSLPIDDCWSLFRHQAFEDGNSDAHPNLVRIGKEIVKKCQGLPMVVKALGGLLYSKIDEEEWNNVLASETWELPQNQIEILPALRLSYQHLPARLKQCFLYCSIFPKGYAFDKEKLVHLWMAQGFIHPEGRKSMEYVGNGYFNDLLRRSFFQCSCNYEGQESMHTMHDLIHELAQSVSGDECFRIEDDKTSIISVNARHSSFLCKEIEPKMLEALYKCTGLRTFLLLRKFPHCTEKIPFDPFLQLKCLRVLDLSYTNITYLSDSIGNLRLLRYLDLSKTLLKSLPKSIAGLYNLQTLKLRDCSNLTVLPKDIKKLINLRHLDLESCSNLVCTPPGLGGLTCLQTLTIFIVGKESDCGIEELRNMISLRGSICISKLENVDSKVDVNNGYLNTKNNLHKLKLQWSDGNVSVQPEAEEEVLESLQPNMNLKELRIENYGGTKFPSWMRYPMVSNLVHISLYNCTNCRDLPPIGKLPFLKSLKIDGMLEIRRISPESYGNCEVTTFPSLEVLKLRNMPNLEVWSGVDEGEFDHLCDLSISCCPMLSVLPNLPPSLTKLEISNCEKLTSLPIVPSLQNLVIDECDQKILSSLSKFPLLSSLAVSRLRKLKTLLKVPLRSLKALKELDIEDCDELVSLATKEGLQSLLSLEYLVIWQCPQLETLPDGFPTSLLYLWIRDCFNLKSIPGGLQSLTAMKGLVINNCQQLRSFPEKGLPKSLNFLSIISCSNLISLPEKLLCDLTFLKELEVLNCPQLISLPKGLHGLISLQLLDISNCPRIESFPDPRLPETLKYLNVDNCPLLKERCQKETGAEWYKIEHVPKIKIDGRWIAPA
ncbi:PREDICTED: putative disease resistance protein RGA3 [Nelumbo nucifera]|uniref:Disease resistance protein RGA3 n=2 Tax=Nelumbo nucifera TaxID=4432 RepID=A0A822Z4L5_NELNU|nr:PREDICTED: putative disease resistance protein RGA3 [Nelumbo nucifera]DAD39493.1 TPA_asm: hypothetical protein HUJ06_013816 [Nelumbo nucifera]